jgi:hypothetical protein
VVPHNPKLIHNRGGNVDVAGTWLGIRENIKASAKVGLSDYET